MTQLVKRPALQADIDRGGTCIGHIYLEFTPKHPSYTTCTTLYYRFVSLPYTLLLIIFVFVAWVLYEDPKVGMWLQLQWRCFLLFCQRQWMLVRYNPDSPWVRWAVDQNAKKIAKKLLQEQND